jgi:hypothetical protein
VLVNGDPGVLRSRRLRSKLLAHAERQTKVNGSSVASQRWVDVEDEAPDVGLWLQLGRRRTDWNPLHLDQCCMRER